MHYRLSALSAALLLVLLAAAWIFFAPMQFGGQANYVIVNGQSMEPGFHRGDLVILREAQDYAVGDIVTYRHPTIGAVIHRIIDRNGDRYVFKGDNNDWVDSYQPIHSELIGKLWISLPEAGQLITRARTPQSMAILGGVIGLFFMAPLVSKLRPDRASRRKQTNTASPAVQQLGQSEGLLFALGTIVLGSLLLLILAFLRPATREVSSDISYQQRGSFSYAAEAPAGLYDLPVIQTGEPIFPRLTPAATFNFSYQFISDLPTQLGGSYRLLAEVSYINGWRRQLELQPETAFRGATFSAQGHLDLTRVVSLTQQLEQTTGLDRAIYTVAIIAEVRSDGALGGQPLQESFSPRLEFRLDPVQLQLARDGAEALDPLSPRKEGLVRQLSSEPNTLPLLVVSPRVIDVRWGAASALALAGALLLWMSSRMLREARRDEASRIRIKYRPLLIDVADLSMEPGTQVAETASIDDLARLAVQTSRNILHMQRAGVHSYMVSDMGTVYLYHAHPAQLDLPSLETLEALTPAAGRAQREEEDAP